MELMVNSDGSLMMNPNAADQSRLSNQTRLNRTTMESIRKSPNPLLLLAKNEFRSPTLSLLLKIALSPFDYSNYPSLGAPHHGAIAQNYDMESSMISGLHLNAADNTPRKFKKHNLEVLIIWFECGKGERRSFEQ